MKMQETEDVRIHDVRLSMIKVELEKGIAESNAKDRTLIERHAILKATVLTVLMELDEIV